MHYSILSLIHNHLKKIPSWVEENGELKKWVLIQKAQNQDKELIQILFQDPILRDRFFKTLQIQDSKEIVIFNEKEFIQYIEQKNFTQNNYTKYKNKIGLTWNEKYTNHHNEIVLAWPYKDCVLEGGQTKEEQNRKEIFFHEILAQEEITQLFEPKVFTNPKRILSKSGKAVEMEWDKFHRNPETNQNRGLPIHTITDNLIVRGNNLIALHSLKKEFSGKVKLIYIDPPYNTNRDSFQYNDNFPESTWLTFMKNRLEAAKDLLKEDGAIFVQIDDKEQAYLKVLMDEIFGRENFRETIVIKTSTPSGVNAINVKRGERLFKLKEYILFYSKSPNFRFYPIYIQSEFNKNYKYEVFKTNKGYHIQDLSQRFSNEEELGKYALENYENIYSLEKNNKKAGEKVKAVLELSKKKEEIIEYTNSKNQKILIYKGGVLTPLKERITFHNNEVFFGTLISDLWDDEIFQTNQTEGGVQLSGGKKPEKLLKRILELTTKEGDIVLDYHLGSGTTAAVAHKMGRQYIGIEQLDYGENDSVFRLKKVIEGDPTGISKSVGWKGGGEFVYLELKKYNESFVLEILSAKNKEDLIPIWEQMKMKSFLHYTLDFKKWEENYQEFLKLNLSHQKKILLEILDKNQLYVNLSSLEDKDFQCSNLEKKVTRNFYQIPTTKDYHISS